MSRPRLDRAPLTPPERHADSRAALLWRVQRIVATGEPLVAIARRPGMPKRATLEHWLDHDRVLLRDRHVAAIERQRLICAEELVVEVDRQAAHARGRRRATALRVQITARTALLRLMALAEQAEETPRTIAPACATPLPAPRAVAAPVTPSAPVPDDAAASSFPSSSPPLFPERTALAVLGVEDPRVSVDAAKTRGPSFLDGGAHAPPKAASADHDEQEQSPTAAPANDDALGGPSSVRHGRPCAGHPRSVVGAGKQNVDARPAAPSAALLIEDSRGVQPARRAGHDEEKNDAGAGNSPDCDTAAATLVLPLAEDTIALPPLTDDDAASSSRHSRESGNPESQTDAPDKEELDSRLRGNDEQKETDASSSDDDFVDYAPEDRRYRPRPRTPAASTAPTPARTPVPAPAPATPEPSPPATARLETVVWYPRFDTGVSASNERRHDRTEGWDDYDPFK